MARTQYNTAQGGGSTTINVTLTSVAAGAHIAVFMNCYSDTGSSLSISDDNSDSYTVVGTGHNYDGGNEWCAQWYANNVTGGTTVITVGMNAGNNYFTVVAVEYDSIVTTSPLDVSANNSATSSSATTGNITTTVSDTTMTAVYGQDGGSYTITENGDFTLIFEEEDQAADMPISVIEKFVTATETEAATWTISSSTEYYASIAAYEESGGGGPATGFMTTNTGYWGP